MQDNSSLSVSPALSSAVAGMKYNEINRVTTLKSNLVVERKNLDVEREEDHESSVQVFNCCAPPNSFW